MSYSAKGSIFFDASEVRKLHETFGESLPDFEPSSQSIPLSIIDDRGVFDKIREIERLFLKLYHRIPSSVDVLGAHNLIQSFEILSWNSECLKWKVWGTLISPPIEVFLVNAFSGEDMHVYRSRSDMDVETLQFFVVQDVLLTIFDDKVAELTRSGTSFVDRVERYLIGLNLFPSETTVQGSILLGPMRKNVSGYSTQYCPLLRSWPIRRWRLGEMCTLVRSSEDKFPNRTPLRAPWVGQEVVNLVPLRSKLTHEIDNDNDLGDQPIVVEIVVEANTKAAVLFIGMYCIGDRMDLKLLLAASDTEMHANRYHLAEHVAPHQLVLENRVQGSFQRWQIQFPRRMGQVIADITNYVVAIRDFPFMREAGSLFRCVADVRKFINCQRLQVVVENNTTPFDYTSLVTELLSTRNTASQDGHRWIWNVVENPAKEIQCLTSRSSSCTCKTTQFTSFG